MLMRTSNGVIFVKDWSPARMGNAYMPKQENYNNSVHAERLQTALLREAGYLRRVGPRRLRLPG